MDIKITVTHKSDGALKSYSSFHVPRQGEWIEIELTTYQIEQVVWSPDMMHVHLMVDDIKS